MKPKLSSLVPAVPKGYVPRKPSYTIKQAAAFHGVSPNSIRRLIKGRPGLLRTSNVLAKILILGEDVETLLTRTSL